MADDDPHFAIPRPLLTQLLSTFDTETLFQLHRSITNLGRVNVNSNRVRAGSNFMHELRGNYNRDRADAGNIFMHELHSNYNPDPFNNDHDCDSLKEEIITRLLKTRLPSLDDVVDHDKRVEVCAVCIDGLYRANELIGTLDCGHEYHANCIKKWLIRKNCCPLCKATALIVENEETEDCEYI